MRSDRTFGSKAVAQRARNLHMVQYVTGQIFDGLLLMIRNLFRYLKRMQGAMLAEMADPHVAKLIGEVTRDRFEGSQS